MRTRCRRECANWLPKRRTANRSRRELIRPARPRPSAFKSQVESDVVKREPVAERPAPPPEPEVRSQPVQASAPAEPVARNISETKLDEPEVRREESQPDPAADDPLNRSFGDREQKADTGENLRFDFSDERKQIDDVAPEHEIERPEPDDGGWEVGEMPPEFEAAPRRQAPTLIAEPEPPPRAAPTPTRRAATPLRAPAVRFASPEKSAAFQMGNAGEDSADSVWVGPTHSSGFFLAIFFFVAIGFLVDERGHLWRACRQRALARPGSADRRLTSRGRSCPRCWWRCMTSIRNIYTLKGGHVALVITGNAQNSGVRRCTWSRSTPI